MYIILSKNVLFLTELFNEYSFIVIFLNILIYIFMIINMFLIFFMFDTKFLKSTNQFKLLNNIPMVSITIVILLLSLAGMPPFIGFLSKFLIFIYIFSKSNLFLFMFFLFINLFVIYFYLQNLRFMISKTISNIFVIVNYYANFNLQTLFVTNFFNYINIIGLFYLEEFILLLTFLNSYILF